MAALFQLEELYVSNIPADTTEEEIKALFEAHGGKVKEYVVVSKRTGVNTTRSALMRMEDHVGALSAKTALCRHDIRGKTLNIRW